MSDKDAQPEAWPRAEVIVHETVAEIVVQENPATIHVETPAQATVIAETSGPQRPAGATGATGPVGATGPAGAPGPTGPTGPIAQAQVGSFYDTTTQTNSAGVSGYNTMRFNTTDISNGVSIVSQSRITFAEAGTYNLAFSAQFEKTDGGDDSAEIWLAINNDNVPWTNTFINMHQQDAKTVAAWNFFVTVNANDYAELRWNSIDLNMRILARQAQTNPDRPGVPSIIATVNRVA